MLVHENMLRDFLRLIIWFPVRWIIHIIPVGMSFFLFSLMGDIHFLFARSKNKKLKETIFRSLSLNGKRVSPVIKSYYKNHYLDRLHIFLYPKLNANIIQKYVSVSGLENLDQALQQGKGCILVQPHFGPVQISLLTLSLLGYKMLQIGYPTDDGLSFIGKKVAYKYRLKYENMLSAPIISADKFLGSVFKHLKKNGVVMTTGDGAGGGKMLGKHIEMPFLRTKRMIPVGPASLAVRTGVPLLPTFIFIEKFNHFHLKIEKPIEVPTHFLNSGSRNKAEEDMTKKFIEITEKHIRECPHNYHFWDEL